MRFLRQTATWECRANLLPVGREVEVLIFGSAAGPTSRQRGLWKELAVHYPALESRLRVELAELAQSKQAANFVFQLAAVALPADSEPEYDLELTFGDESGPPQFDVRVASWNIAEIVGPL